MISNDILNLNKIIDSSDSSENLEIKFISPENNKSENI